MPVVAGSVIFHWAGSTGSTDRDGPVEYTALWRLDTNDPLDQAATVVSWWQLNMFDIGSAYSYANDIYGAGATAQNISAIRQLETNTNWIVQVTYSREDDAAKKDLADLPSTNPLNYRPIIQCSSNAETRPGNRLFYKSGYSARVAAKIPTTVTIPVASNMQPFDPLPEEDQYNWFISVEANLATFNADQSYVGYINTFPFQVSYKGFTRGPVSEHHAKIRDCEVTFRRENTLDFWQIRYYIELRPEGDPFLHQIPDIGMDILGCPGEQRPNMHGNQFGAGVNNTPIIEGRSLQASLIDAHGQPIRAPVPLDGDGLPADVCAQPFVPVYGVWWNKLEVDYYTVPIIKDILVPVTP